MADLWVDPDMLGKTAGSIKEIGTRMLQVVPPSDQPLVAPGEPGQQGWAAWGAMVTAGQQWSAEVASLINQLESLGHRVEDAAQTYRDTDRKSADGLGLMSGL